MRQVYNLLLALPDACARVSFEELLILAALVTLVVTVFLIMSGRGLV